MEINPEENLKNRCQCDASDLQPFGDCICGANKKKVSKQDIIDYINEWTWYVGIKGNNRERAAEGMQTPEEYFKNIDI